MAKWRTRGMLLGMLVSAPALAQGSKVSSPVALGRAAEQLKPGQWVWAPQVAPDGPVLVYVDLSRQLATVYRNGVRIAVTTISSGKPGHQTPTGVFTILEKHIDHRSNKYNDAPMPYMQRLTWDGIALHAGVLPGAPASHGCVRLPYAFARALFGITRTGMTVVVENDAAAARIRGATNVMQPVTARGTAAASNPLTGSDNGWRWTPEKSPTGPMTILVSESDKRVIVLRNGVEIGRSVVDIDGSDGDSHVLQLTTGPDGKRRWIYLGLPGQEAVAGQPVDDAVLKRMRTSAAFRTALTAALTPGTTVLITPSNLGTTIGPNTPILDAVTASK